MKRISVIGTGYVGLVTGVCLAEVGHQVICLDIDKEKIKQLQKGKSPIYEPGLEDLISKNISEHRLSFTSKYEEALQNAEVIYIAVGTPQQEDGSANLTYIEEAVSSIARHIHRDAIVVIKSTVPVGTNDTMYDLFALLTEPHVKVEVVSNPEFLREGSAIHDTFHGDRIVIGTKNKEAAFVMEEINKPFGLPIIKTDIRSAEMIKYASNAFLATKISFINEISTVCEKLGANVEDVARGMGMDKRIGPAFLQAGIGYGGSCFPKDTNALMQIAGNVEHSFHLLEAVINVNNKQQVKLVEKALNRFGSLHGKKVGVLGLAFKPNTDDVREAASISVVNRLVSEGALVKAYDPIAMESAKKVINPNVRLMDSIEDTIQDTDMIFIVTEWQEFIDYPLEKIEEMLMNPIIFDGRNCFELEKMSEYNIEYHSVGRPVMNRRRC